MAQPFILNFKPGVQRDGTELDSDSALEAVWCRWRLGKPRKMRGFQEITSTLNGLPRRLHCYYTGDRVYVHVGTTAGIQQVVIDTLGNLISINDRTPPSFVGGIQAGFTMDALFDTTSSTVQLIVHVAQDMLNLPDATASIPFIGQITSTANLAPLGVPAALDGGTYTAPAITGGIVAVQPYLFGFDSEGHVLWSAPNAPDKLGITGGTSGAGSARVSAQKIVAGFPLRGGGGQAPAAVFWSLSEVITASFVGQDNGIFRFNTVSPSSSILSSDCVIEYDGLYFWAGVDRMMVFNGTVTEVPNNFNLDFFFDNLTPGQEAKAFAFKVPRFGEIWWCAALFGSEEPNWAIIFNLRENCWYDTPLPGLGRSCGFYAQGFRYPLMGDVGITATGYRLWMHEIGTDAVTADGAEAIESSFVTPWMGSLRSDQPTNQGLSLEQLEMDIEQGGDMTAQLITRANAKAPVIEGPTVPVPLIAATVQEELSSFTPRQPGRQVKLKFTSNVPGGDYVMGRSVGHATPTDQRRTS